MALTAYLGAPAAQLLAVLPFSSWSYSRSVEDDLPAVEIRYEFEEQKIALVCDESERITTISLHAGVDQALAPIPMNLDRNGVLDRVGVPSKSGPAIADPILGDYGPWDRFESISHTLHVQYGLRTHQIELLTLMHPDVVPR